MIEWSQLSQVELQRHHLEGYAYSKSKQDGFRDCWKKQVTKNQLVATELKRLGESFSKVDLKVTLLKGFALLGDVHKDWGARFASDVDVLVHPKYMQRVCNTLQFEGYREVEDEKWMANSFKKVFLKKTTTFEVVIEVHSKLFWNTSGFDYCLRPFQPIPGFYQLSHEVQLLHLCGHLAFQHNFLKLFWLFDIKEYVESKKDQIDWPIFWRLSEEHSLMYSSAMCLHLVGEEVPLKSFRFRLLKTLVNNRFLTNPRKHFIRYFLTKILIKDQLKEGVQYVWGWFRKKKKS